MRSTTPGAVSRRQRVHPQEGYLGRPRDPLPTRVEETPPLPDAFARALDDGLAEAGFDLSPGQRAAVDGHVRLLLSWNASINLTAIREPAEIARLHVLDSLTAVAPLRELGVDRLLDLGSGAGFPGVPLGLALPAEVGLVESVGKKAAFLRAVTAAVGPAGSVFDERAESLAREPGQREMWPCVVARAVARLPELVELALPLLRRGGWLVAWKRGDLRAELAAGERAAAALGGGRPTVVDPRFASLPGHRLVVVEKARPTPAGWPRDPAERRRRPW